MTVFKIVGSLPRNFYCNACHSWLWKTHEEMYEIREGGRTKGIMCGVCYSALNHFL